MTETPVAVSALRLREVAAGPAPAVAAHLVSLFDQLRPLADKAQWVQRRIAEDLRGPLDEVLDRACAVVAQAIDADALAFDGQAYHNRQHLCEVALTAYVLCLLKRLPIRDIQFVLLAALVHDFVHDGRSHAPFVQERASVERVRIPLEAAGVDMVQMRRLTVLVLATDASCGSGFTAQASRAHGKGGVLPVVPPAAPELAELIGDAVLADLARTLCEADILPSVGLTIEHAMRLQASLALEWGRPLGVGDKLEFMDAVLARGLISEFFLPNVHATRAALAPAANDSA